jgi:hypothetical protein
MAGASLAACASQTTGQAMRNTGMGIDAFGHTQLSEERTIAAPDRLAHLQRLIAYLRSSLPKYRSVELAVADGYRPEGPDVPVGALKHFVNYANIPVNWQHLDAAGGVFMDNVFGWMVHVYPFENDIAKQF